MQRLIQAGYENRRGEAVAQNRKFESEIPVSCIFDTYIWCSVWMHAGTSIIYRVERNICHHFLSTLCKIAWSNRPMHWRIWVTELWSFVPCVIHSYPRLKAPLIARALYDPHFAQYRACRALCRCPPLWLLLRTSRVWLCIMSRVCTMNNPGRKHLGGLGRCYPKRTWAKFNISPKASHADKNGS